MDVPEAAGILTLLEAANAPCASGSVGGQAAPQLQPACEETMEGGEADPTNPRHVAPPMKQDGRGVIWSRDCDIFFLKNACKTLAEVARVLV